MAKRMVAGYLSYNFRDKDPVVDQLRTLLQDENASYKEVHELSGVSVSTLYNWFEGPTRRPQYATVMAVARSLGYDYKLVKVGKVARLTVVRKGAV
jgi:transcriptional regulator with XRE-family HTH domain